MSFDRPEKEYHVRKREDRIGRYFRKYLKDFIFVEFSPEFLGRSKVADIMTGVPIPLHKEDVKVFAGGTGIKPSRIADNMAWVIGSDPKFKYADKYIDYLFRIFNKKAYEGMMKTGRDAAEKEDYDNACIHFRASLAMAPDYLHSMYSYARVCRSMYMASEDEEYVGRFKAESLDFFELLTEAHPRFAQGYYYLGYGYLNMGLYGKAQAAWMEMMKRARNRKDRKEIEERLEMIKDPVKIEEGYNHILATRYVKGLEILEPFRDSRFDDWWPLHYYLGIGYERTGDIELAEMEFKRVLVLNASHIETMKELVDIYQERKDKEKAEKYRKKIQIIEGAISEERIELEKARPGSPYNNEKEVDIKIKKEKPKEIATNQGESQGNKIKRLTRP